MIVRSKLIALCLFVATLFASNLQADVFVPSGLNPGDVYRLIFITSGARDANSTLIDDYNTFVQTQANNPGTIVQNAFLTVDYFAIGSTVDVDAIDNIMGPSSVPIYNLNVAAGGGSLLPMARPTCLAGRLVPTSRGISLAILSRPKTSGPVRYPTGRGFPGGIWVKAK